MIIFKGCFAFQETAGYCLVQRPNCKVMYDHYMPLLHSLVQLQYVLALEETNGRFLRIFFTLTSDAKTY